MADKVVIKLEGLDALAKAFKNKIPIVKIGILGSDASAAHGEATVGEVGAVHEFGNSTTAKRSFLLMPLTTKLNSELDKSDLKKEDYLKEVIKTKTLRVFMGKIAVLCESVVAKAFASNGFGQWARWKNPNYKSNTGMILVDTTKLRESISTEVK